MRPRLLTAAALVALAAPAFAQGTAPEPELSCDKKSLPAELAQLCAGLADSFRDAMSRAAATGKDAPKTSGRPALKPSPTKPLISHEITARGVAPTVTSNKSPFVPPEDRGVGVRLKSNEAPVQVFTEMVQPSSDAETIMNWELKAENAPADTSGLFYGAATGGTYNPGGTTENVSGFAGLRGVVKPADNVQLGAEIAPRAGIANLETPEGSVVLEPKLTAKSNLGQLGDSDFVGSLNADAAYSMPLEGDPSAWAGFRFTVKPK
jgi:hypothetical protein